MDTVSRTDGPSWAALTPLAYLHRAADLWGDRPATSFEGHTRNYTELHERVRRLAGALAASGVRPGDRVAALLPNVPAMLELHYAVPGAGAVLVPLNPRLSEAELTYVLEHSGTRLLVTHPETRAAATAAVEALGARVRMIVTGADGDYEDFLQVAEPATLVGPDETDLLSINYTSGTTGPPKGVMYIHRGAYLHALGMLVETRLDAASRYLWTLPMFHCNGWAFTWAVTAAGACHVCLERFEPETVWRLIGDERITHLCGAPTVLSMLAESPGAAPVPRRVSVYTGGAPPTPTLLRRTHQLNFDVTQLYGLTETYGPLAVCARRPEWEGLDDQALAVLKARQGVGTVVSVMLRVVDDRMRDVPRDGKTLGEVVMRGNNIMQGYYRDEAATKNAFAGGWFHSGDLGVMHEHGYVELRDRLKDIVISGGENISTIEVERVLCLHRDVVEAAVIGVPDERWGERPAAFVTLRSGAAVTGEELQDMVREHLARFKVPRSVTFVPELPKTATGKIEKFRLREMVAAEADAVVR